MTWREGCWAFFLLIALLFPPAGYGQVGSTTDILTGVIIGMDDAPLAGAQVEATSIETQITRRQVTDVRGRYTIVFPDGGGQYQLMVRAIGLAPQRLLVVRRADEDRLVTNVHLTAAPFTLAPVVTRARQPNREQDNSGPGGQERILTGEQLSQLPLDASDLSVITTLVPGVVGVAGTDSTVPVFSVAGLRPSANAVTLDGLSFGSGSVPQDAVRATRVMTTTYDVARGLFSGGLVSSTTKSGNNVPQGTFTFSLRDRSVEWGPGTASAFGRGSTQGQFGGGFGGPIVYDRLFWFASLQGRLHDRALTALSTADAAVLQRLGVSPDSAALFEQLAQASGFPAPFVDSIASTDNAVGLARLDWIITPGQTLTVRGDGRWTSQQPTHVAALALPETGGWRRQSGGGVLVGLTSNFGRLVNELKGYVSVTNARALPYLAVPHARVQVISELADSGLGVTTLVFGGNGSLPQLQHDTSAELREEISVLTGTGAHRVKLGVYGERDAFDDDATTNQFGTFVFPSLAALAANQPSAFTRTLAPAPRHGSTEQTAAYLGDAWRVGGGLQLAFGMRLEGTRFTGAPPLNTTIDSLFGFRTDRIPRQSHLSPRFGFTWLLGRETGRHAAVPASTVLRGGVGDFRSVPPTGLIGAALAASGLAGSEAQLVCVGSAVPVPDWRAYAQNPAAIPSSCAAASPITAQPTVTVFDPSFRSPHAWRTSLEVQQHLFSGFTFSVNASYSRGEDQYGVHDANLGPMQFALPAEGGRPVFVPASAIDTTSGLSSVDASRRVPLAGRVLVLGSDLRSDSKQVSISFGGFTVHGLTLQTSYTWTQARDQSSFNCCSATQGFSAPTTAGDPNVREWATSDLERRHALLATLAVSFGQSIQLTTIGRLTSGVPFTPLVGSDINGDGARNDRAYVFDPSSVADTALAHGMTRLLAGAAAGVRRCLTRQAGRVAARNSCSGPWQGSFDVMINVSPTLFGLDHRLTLSLLSVNLLSGLDALLHGSKLHGWGLSGAPDGALLYVRGFDPATTAYRYAVNERFGALRSGALGITVPFQLALQLHLVLGPAAGGFGGFGGGAGRPGVAGGGAPAGPSPAEVASPFTAPLPNPVAGILRLMDSLRLSTRQVAFLQRVSDMLDARNIVVRDSLRAIIDRAGPRPDQALLSSRLRPYLQQSQEHAREALDLARLALTAEQWKKLPDALKLDRRD